MICGAGHSGSTLLGMLLGSHSRAFYMGEGGKVRYLGDTTKPLHKRVCKICGESCPVWGDFRWDRAAPLCAWVAARVGRRVIVDSTKNGRWITDRVEETRAAGGEPCLILLRRDGRAVLNSRLRKYPDRCPEALVRDWIAQMERSQALHAGFDGPKLCVDYERLATEPEPVLRAVCGTLGLPYEPAMLRFHAAEHHPLGRQQRPPVPGRQGAFQERGRRLRHAEPTLAPVLRGARRRDPARPPLEAGARAGESGAFRPPRRSPEPSGHAGD